MVKESQLNFIKHDLKGICLRESQAQLQIKTSPTNERNRGKDQNLPSQSGLVTAFTFPHRFSSALNPGARRRALRDASFRPSTQHGTRRNAAIAVVDEFSGTMCRRDGETEDMQGETEEAGGANATVIARRSKKNDEEIVIDAFAFHCGEKKKKKRSRNRGKQQKKATL